MLGRLGSLVVKEFIQFSRDRLLLAFAFAAPVLEMVFIGATVGQDITELRLAVYDQDRTDLSRDIISALDHTEELALTYYPSSLEELHDLVESGQASVAEASS